MALGVLLSFSGCAALDRHAGPVQILTVSWLVDEDRSMDPHAPVYASINPPGADTYTLEAYGYGVDDAGDGFNTETAEATVEFVITEFLPSGTYTLYCLSMKDAALNQQPVHLTGHEGEESPLTIDIATGDPDVTAPELDLNAMSISAAPTNLEVPNGETQV